MEYNEDEYLLLSGIQHFIFCKRQWALIHIEQQWEENVRTIEGKFVHNRAHNTELKELRKDIYTVRGLRIYSNVLGVTGECDVVEFKKDEIGTVLYGKKGLWSIYPIEYKKGKPKEDFSDEAQLYAQAMCLEEMFCCEVNSGALFYNEIKHRKEIVFIKELKKKVKEIFNEMHSYYKSGYTPRVKMTKSCNACSLKNICIPVLLKNANVKEYIYKHLNGDM